MVPTGLKFKNPKFMRMEPRNSHFSFYKETYIFTEEMHQVRMLLYTRCVTAYCLYYIASRRVTLSLSVTSKCSGVVCSWKRIGLRQPVTLAE